MPLDLGCLTYNLQHVYNRSHSSHANFNTGAQTLSSCAFSTNSFTWWRSQQQAISTQQLLQHQNLNYSLINWFVFELFFIYWHSFLRNVFVRLYRRWECHLRTSSCWRPRLVEENDSGEMKGHKLLPLLAPLLLKQSSYLSRDCWPNSTEYSRQSSSYSFRRTSRSHGVLKLRCVRGQIPV